MSATGPISIRLVVCVASVSNQVISEFTQRDGRKKRTAKHLCVTKVTGLLPETHKVSAITWQFCLPITLMFPGLLQKICSKEFVVWRKVFSNKIIVTLVTQGLPSSFPSRPVA